MLALAAMLGGMLLHSPWLVIAGFFIMIGAQIEDQGVFFQSVVDTVRMREVMLTDFATLSPSDTLADALARCVHSLQEDFPVVRGPQLVGIVSRQRIVDALRNDGNGYVQSVMSRAFQVARPEDTLGTTIRRLTAGHGLALIPVTESGRVVGIVSVQNLMSSMSLLAEQRRIEREEAEQNSARHGPTADRISPSLRGLYLVATPIGNLGDITLRALDVLRRADRICLRRHPPDAKAAQPLPDHHAHRKLPRAQRARARRRTDRSAQGRRAHRRGLRRRHARHQRSRQLARLRAAIAAGIPVIPIPGANAALSALIASGLPTGEFHFLGFLPEKAGARRTRLEELAAEAGHEPRTLDLLRSAAPHSWTPWPISNPSGARTSASSSPANSPRSTKNSCAARSPTSAANSPPAIASAAKSPCWFKLRPRPHRLSRAAGGRPRRPHRALQTEGIDEKEALKRLARELGQSKSDLYRELQRQRARRELSRLSVPFSSPRRPRPPPAPSLPSASRAAPACARSNPRIGCRL